MLDLVEPPPLACPDAGMSFQEEDGVVGPSQGRVVFRMNAFDELVGAGLAGNTSNGRALDSREVGEIERVVSDDAHGDASLLIP